ncbi:MAG: hypothetical protein R3D29_03115 [Nitratireductor sp.]
MTAAAMKAGRGLSRDFGEVQNLQVSMKGPGDFVSAADRKAEGVIRAELQRAHSEYSACCLKRAVQSRDLIWNRWIVDPLVAPRISCTVFRSSRSRLHRSAKARCCGRRLQSGNETTLPQSAAVAHTRATTGFA